VGLGILEWVDRDTLASYVLISNEWRNAIALAQKCTRAHVENGVKIPPDEKLAEKWISVAEKYFKQAQRCAESLGITPVSRSRLVVPGANEAEEDNPLEALRKRYQGA